MKDLRVAVRLRQRKAVKLLADDAPGEFRLDGRVVRRGALVEAAHPAHDRVAQVDVRREHGAPLVGDAFSVFGAEDEERLRAAADAVEQVRERAVEVADSHRREEDPRLRDVLADGLVLLRPVEPERVHRPDRQRHDLLSGHVGGVFMAALNVRDQVRPGLGIHERQRVFVLEFRPEEAERKRAGAEDDDAVSQFKVLPQ